MVSVSFPAPGGLLKTLASPRLTVAFFLLMAAGAIWVSRGGEATSAALLPLALLVVNLAAAIFCSPRFRADLPLLLFHLSLLALVALFAVARLTYFNGAAILTSGTAFTGKLLLDQHGPLHGDGLDHLRFANEGFTENFPERGKYHATYNRVRWWDETGASGIAEIGDDRPLLLDGYRIYTTSRRGFSPLFYWQPESGNLELGTVQLPDYDSAGLGPAVAWHLPGGQEAWAMLVQEAVAEQPPAGQRAGLGAPQAKHHLILRIGEQRWQLRPGEEIDLDGGKLTYVQLDSWMGYRIVHDMTEPWLVATVLVGIGALLWFYGRIFRRSGERMRLEGKQ